MSLENVRATTPLKVALCLGFILVQLDVSVVNVGLDALRASFNAQIADLEWVINAYALVFAAFLLASGPLSEKYGPKKTFIGGVTAFIFASIGCALSPTIHILVGFRCLQGLGAAMLVPTSLTLIRLAFNSQVERSSAIGAWGASGSLALAAGPVIGGLMISAFGWNSIFLINVPIGIAVVWFTVKYGPTDTPKNTVIDTVGQGIIVLALGLLTYGLTESATYGWKNSITLSTFIGGLALVLVFIWQQTKSLNPVLPNDMLRNPILSGATFVAFSSTLVFYGAVFVLSLYFQTVLNFGAATAGLAFLPMMLTTACATFFAGRFATYFSIRQLVPIGMAITAAGFLGLCWITSDWDYAKVVWPTLLIGVGTSLVVPSLANTMFAVAPVEQASSVSGIFSSARQVGGVVGVSIFGFVLSAYGHAQFIGAIRTIAVLCVLTVVLSAIVGVATMPKRDTIGSSSR